MRLAAMFRESRNKVMTSNKEGKTEKLTGCWIYMEAIRMITERVMSREMRKSNNSGGRGTIITAMMQTTAIGMSKCAFLESLGNIVCVKSSSTLITKLGFA